ncbi:uncharacterized protein A4U43_C01F18780 [Asparagus officinalis]|uniref:Uncharacterized protein n=1 Tax=Asparagus officinalis TaxID=4686 RepID=A0A5P1FR09_ASPOF|nr:uncharacterized protein A4U43_C01F18780 [Asparagus officinalis]
MGTNLGNVVPGLKYAYAKFDPLKSSCEHNYTSLGSEIYPDGNSIVDLRFDLSLRNVKGNVMLGNAISLAFGGKFFGTTYPQMALEKSLVEKNYNSSQSLWNVSYTIIYTSFNSTILQFNYSRVGYAYLSQETRSRPNQGPFKTHIQSSPLIKPTPDYLPPDDAPISSFVTPFSQIAAMAAIGTLKKKIQRKFKIRGFTLKTEAIDEAISFLSRYPALEEDEALELLINELD